MPFSCPQTCQSFVTFRFSLSRSDLFEIFVQPKLRRFEWSIVVEMWTETKVCCFFSWDFLPLTFCFYCLLWPRLCPAALKRSMCEMCYKQTNKQTVSFGRESERCSTKNNVAVLERAVNRNACFTVLCFIFCFLFNLFYQLPLWVFVLHFLCFVTFRHFMRLKNVSF